PTGAAGSGSHGKPGRKRMKTAHKIRGIAHGGRGRLGRAHSVCALAGVRTASLRLAAHTPRVEKSSLPLGQRPQASRRVRFFPHGRKKIPSVQGEQQNAKIGRRYVMPDVSIAMSLKDNMSAALIDLQSRTAAF